MPAGLHMPKSHKLAFNEQIPHIYLKHQGKDNMNFLVKQEIEDKKKQAFENYRNKDKVGMLISPEMVSNPVGIRFELDKEEFIRKLHTRDCSDFN